MLRTAVVWSLALAHGRASSTPHDSKARIIEQFNLSHARAGPEAVDEAVNFILQQEKAKARLALNAGHHAAHPNATYADAPPATAGGAPTCAVSYERIRRDGVFVHRGADAPPPYDWACWCMRARYHVAPACARAQPFEPAWRWL